MTTPVLSCRKCSAQLPAGAVYCHICGTKQAAPRHGVKKRGNGQGSVFKLANGKYKATVVLAYYIDQDGKQRKRTASATFTKKADAIAAIPTLLQQRNGVRTKDMTLFELSEIYFNSKEHDALSKSQRDKLNYAWTRLKPIEMRAITTLTVDDLQRTIDGAVSTYYPARDMKVCLSHLYNIAIRKEIVQYNKTEYIELPAAPKAKRECWTQDEVEAMWSDFRSHPFTGFVLIMCYAGLRYGELATVELENIHLDQDYMIGGIKTEAGIDREIPIHHRIKPIIAQLLATQRYKLLEMNEDNFYKAYWDMIARTGIRQLPPQTCRHYYFSSMTAAGVEGGVIAETGGHASFLTTMKNYVRIPLADKLAAVNKIQ